MGWANTHSYRGSMAAQEGVHPIAWGVDNSQIHCIPAGTSHEMVDLTVKPYAQLSMNRSTTRPNQSQHHTWRRVAYAGFTTTLVNNVPYTALYKELRGPKPKTILTLAIILSIAAGVPLPIIGVLFGKIINSFPPSEEELRDRIGQLLAVALAYFIVTWGWAVCWGIIGETISKELREGLVKKVLGMDQTYFDVNSPDLTNILTEQIQIVQSGTSEKVGLFIQALSYFVAAFVAGLVLNARLTGILLGAVIPAMTLVVYLGNRTVRSATRDINEIGEITSKEAENAIQAVPVVQAFDATEPLAASHATKLQRRSRIGIRKAIYSAVMLGAVFFVAYSANSLAFFEGYIQQSRERDESNGAGTIYAVVFLILDASFVVGQFGPFIQIFSAAASAGQKIFSVLHHPQPEIDVYSGEGEAVSPKTFCSDISFEDTSFSYPARPSMAALNHANFVLRCGTVTGIVGASGSGKSTIASLLARLYDASEGRILLGNREFRNYNVTQLRQKIAVVSQDPVLFAGSILENIKYGLDKSTLPEHEIIERCIQAASEANCHFLADLPSGIHTDVGSQGFARLSGGQKQRVCLARALVRQPSLLILDEYTSALDPVSERAVIDSLKRSSAAVGRTTVIIGHRLATVRDADSIIVMGAGTVLEQGCHDALLEANGAYCRLLEANNFETADSDNFSNSGIETPVSSNHLKDDDKVEDKGPGQPEQQPLNEQQVASLATLQVIYRCLSLSKPEWRYLCLGLFASFISGCVMIGEAVVLGNLVQILKLDSSDKELKSPNFFCGMFFLLSVVALLSYSVSGSAFGVLSERFVARVQDLLLKSILRQDLAWFSRHRSSPLQLMATLNMDAGHLKGLSGSILGVLLSALVSVIGGILLAHVVAWKIAVVLLPAVPIMLVAGFLRIRVLSLAEERQQKAYVSATSQAAEACKQIRTVATYGLEREFSSRFNNAIQLRSREGARFLLSANLSLAFSLAITYFVYALAYWWGAKQVRHGTYNSLEFFIVLPALLFSAQSAGQMFSFAPEITRAKMASRNLFALLDEQPTILSGRSIPPTISNEALGTAGRVQQAYRVEFRDVSFSYPTRVDRFALQNASITVQAKKFVGIVGPSGAGKSSILALIERYYDPSVGSIHIDGEDIRNISVQRHRARLGYVAQESDLFAGTVSFNISLGARPGQQCTRSDIINVCKQCSIHDFIMGLPEGYDTECGQNGSRLSGGQRQRIAIARALLRDPDILLLDEPTSQLDALAERDIRQAISAAAKGRTVIMVTHKLASVQHADSIYVFNKGKKVEQGTHSELLALRGVYASLVRAQELS